MLAANYIFLLFKASKRNFQVKQLLVAHLNKTRSINKAKDVPLQRKRTEYDTEIRFLRCGLVVGSKKPSSNFTTVDKGR